ncbi:class I SAM-dependent methyltransferase [Methanosarcina flavescens]|uniref:class I SAM-dependent methyltransferase n=1 Tax=Methanosarcina flavescens TaxID=1715806 RepID=UPI000A53D78B|nr:class I SAM-dependent methyltransferase [Methanosarcina flavescens]
MPLNPITYLLFLIDVARKKQFEKPLHGDKESLRFATPEPIARYRAQRLRAKTLADISCGIGGQTVFFAQQCGFVYAVEIDPKKIEYAKQNCAMYGLSNVKFICGDALDPKIIEQIPAVDVIFSDPFRPAEESKRQVSSLEPGIPNVLAAYGEKTRNFAFEAPPQMPPERIPFDCEKEYISLDGQLNRLTLYFGGLKQHDRMAVALPAGEGLVSKYGMLPQIKETDKMKLCAYEPEPSVVAAELLPELVESMMQVAGPFMGVFELFRVDKKRLLLTSDALIKQAMIKNHYLVLKVCPFEPKEINKFLKDRNIGNVVLRAGVKPEDYWKVRNEVEKGLEGNKTVHLFVKGRTAILCEVIFNE